MNTLKTFGVGAASLALILLVVGGGYNLLSLSLGTVTIDYFVGAVATVVLLGGAWLSMQGLGIFGKPFMFCAVVMLVAISVRHRAPGIAELFVQTTQAADRTARNAAVDISAARAIPCDRTTTTLKFFERETRDPLVWLAEDESGRLICFDRPGFHPQNGKKLVPVDEKLARIIRLQEPSTPTAAPTPAPLRDLGTDSLPELGVRPVSK